jgi:DNA-binding MarR family transcriptional regulator
MTTIVLSRDTTAAGANATVYSTGTHLARKSPSGTSSRDVKQKIDIESAVFAHIQALRALGITRTDSLEIARGLGLDQSDVEKTVSSLVKKGVKIVNG